MCVVCLMCVYCDVTELDTRHPPRGAPRAPVARWRCVGLVYELKSCASSVMDTPIYTNPQISTATISKSSDEARHGLPKVELVLLDPYARFVSSQSPNMPPPPRPSESRAAMM